MTAPDETGTPMPADAPRSAASVLFDLAMEQHTFMVSTDGEPFAVPKFGPRIVRQLRGGRNSFRAELARSYRLRTGRVAGQQALADALLALEGEANDTDPVDLALRVAEDGADRYLDLGDTTGRVVKINSGGWMVMPEPPEHIRFRRTVLTGRLPVPERGGDLSALWPLLNVEKEDWPVLLGALVAVLWPNIPHPIVAIVGEQGTAKTSAAKMVTGLLDPSPVQVRKAPRDADSWVTAASGSFVVGLDNLSAIPDWLSDTLCRASTGDGDVRRQLYSDGGLVVFSFRRVVVLTGIDLGSIRGDLADRLITVDLRVIEPGNRLEESDIWGRWDQLHPSLLGAVLDLAASVARVLPSVHLDSKPRMADFARILSAVDQTLGTDGLKRYTRRAETLAAESLSGDLFVSAVAVKFVGDEFSGTAADLLMLLPEPADDRRHSKSEWPAKARDVTALLKRQAPVMRKAGWSVIEGPPGHQNAIVWKLTPPPP